MVTISLSLLFTLVIISEFDQRQLMHPVFSYRL